MYIRICTSIILCQNCLVIVIRIDNKYSVDLKDLKNKSNCLKIVFKHNKNIYKLYLCSYSYVNTCLYMLYNFLFFGQCNSLNFFLTFTSNTNNYKNHY